MTPRMDIEDTPPGANAEKPRRVRDDYDPHKYSDWTGHFETRIIDPLGLANHCTCNGLNCCDYCTGGEEPDWIDADGRAEWV